MNVPIGLGLILIGEVLVPESELAQGHETEPVSCPILLLLLRFSMSLSITAKSVLREALQGPDDHSVASQRMMIGQALQSAANHLGYARSDTGTMIVHVEDLLNLAHEFIQNA